MYVSFSRVETYHIFRTIRHTFSPQIWEENEGASYSPNVAYLARSGGQQWSGVTGGRSRVSAVGSQHRQEWGDAAGPGLGGGGVPAGAKQGRQEQSPHCLSLIHISEPTRLS